MNLAKKISLFAVAALLFASCKNTDKEATNEEGTAVESTMEAPAEGENATNEDAETKDVAANFEKVSFKIDGMTCAVGCAGVIESKLAGLDGVKDAKVDFENKTATVLFGATEQTTESIVATVEKIADGAYKVSDVNNEELPVEETQS